MNTLSAPTGPIFYDVQGAGERPIILLPSGAHDHHDFDELRALLPTRFRSITLDWPAHGASPPGEGSVTDARLADIAEQLVEELAPDGAVVLGNSVGGYAAARLAIRRPELVKGLVIVDGSGFEPRTIRGRVFCALMAQRWFVRAYYATFSAQYMQVQTEADRRARETAIATTRQDPGLRAIAQLWRSFTNPEHDLRQAAKEIAAPTLALWGRHDPVFPVAVAESITQMIENASVVVFNSGHVPHTSDPAGVASQLVPFADRAFENRPLSARASVGKGAEQH